MLKRNETRESKSSPEMKSGEGWKSTTRNGILVSEGDRGDGGGK